MADFEDKKSSKVILINETISANEVVASDVSPRYLFCFSFKQGRFFFRGEAVQREYGNSRRDSGLMIIYKEKVADLWACCEQSLINAWRR